MIIELDKSIEKPVYTAETARKEGWSEEEITKIFGKPSEKGMDALCTLARSIAEIIHYAKRG